MSFSQAYAEPSLRLPAAPSLKLVAPLPRPGQWAAGAELPYGRDPIQRGQEVLHGVVVLQREVAPRRRVVVEILGPGAVLGAGLPGVDDCIARAATAVQLQPAGAARVKAGLLARIAALHERAMVIDHGSAEQRLAWLLLLLAGNAGEGVVTLPLTRRDIAGYLAVTPETISRSLAALRQRGLIGQILRDDVELTDIAGLRELVRAPGRVVLRPVV